MKKTGSLLGYRVRTREAAPFAIFCRDDEKNAEVANVLTWDEGRRITVNIAKLPDLLSKTVKPLPVRLPNGSLLASLR